MTAVFGPHHADAHAGTSMAAGREAQLDRPKQKRRSKMTAALKII
jgi:hypothetical protein